jgi:hypothetical protein
VEFLPDNGDSRRAGETMRTPPEPLTGLQAKVAPAAVKGDRTIAQLAEHFDIHPNQITASKSQRRGFADDDGS